MKSKGFLYFVLTLFCVAFVFTHLNCDIEEKEEEMSKEDMIKRGEYLVVFGGCHDCHTPKTFGPEGMLEDTTRMLSGHPQDEPLPPINTNEIEPGKWYLGNSHLTAWVGPWGVSFARNLTPDEATGTGAWTEEIFIKSMRTGKQMGHGRPLLPPMPWFNVAKLTDEDLKSVFAYLQSIKPIKNKVPDPIPPDSLFAKK